MDASYETRRIWVFLHIAKTAGTSVAANLLELLDPSSQCPFRTDEDLERAPNLHEFDYFHGHFTFNCVRRLLPLANLVTMLRHPGPRAVSHYQSWHDSLNADPTWQEHLARDGAAREALVFTQDADIKEYFASGLPSIQRQFTNYQTYMLSSCDITVTPFAVWDPDVLTAARNNLLGAFRYYGITERMGESLELLRREVGKSGVPVRPHVLNSSRFRSESYADTDVMRLVEARNPMDLELYRFAAEEFENRLGGLRASTAAAV